MPHTWFLAYHGVIFQNASILAEVTESEHIITDIFHVANLGNQEDIRARYVISLPWAINLRYRLTVESLLKTQYILIYFDTRNEQDFIP
jgi:hypothetical protein